MNEILHRLNQVVAVLREILRELRAIAVLLSPKQPGPPVRLTGTVGTPRPNDTPQGAAMAPNIELQDAQNVTITLGETDEAGNPTPFAVAPGTLAASFADATEWDVTVDEAAGTVNVKATGALVSNDVLTITATAPDGATPLEPLTYTFDEVGGPPTALTGVVGTPQAN